MSGAEATEVDEEVESQGESGVRLSLLLAEDASAVPTSCAMGRLQVIGCNAADTLNATCSMHHAQPP